MMLSRVRTCPGSHRPRDAAIGRFPGLTLAHCRLDSERVVGALIKKYESDLSDARVGRPHCLQRDARRIVDRPAIDAGRNGWESECARAQFIGDGERVSEAVREQL